MKILHIITSLETGGAQGVLLELSSQMRHMGHQQAVISMKPGGDLGEKFRNLGIPLYELDFSLAKFARAVTICNQIISTLNPDIIQSMLYHADFLSLFLRYEARTKVVWGIHHSFEKNRSNRLKMTTKTIAKINASMSKKIPDKIICCSQSALQSHKKIGYDPAKLVFIPNGIDANKFKPNPQAKILLRAELGLPPDTPIIGYLARFHPQKNHPLFFTAANRLLDTVDDVHFVLAGNKVTDKHLDIRPYMDTPDKISHFHLLGRREDSNQVTAGLDIATLTASGGEAFPLTMIEAMSCGVPCVSTDVGDVRSMIENTGIVVPVDDPVALSQAWLKMLHTNHEERIQLGEQSRKKVLESYTSEIMANRFLEVYSD